MLAPLLAEFVPSDLAVWLALYLLDRRRTAEALPGTGQDAGPLFPSGP